VINDNTVLVELSKDKTIYKKPIMIGFTVLELSKMLMADFYYNVMKRYYGDRCKLIYTDTDSSVCYLKTQDPMKDFSSPDLKDFFELPDTVKVPGLMKVESLCYFFGAYSPKNYIYVTRELKINFKKKSRNMLLPK
jgi:hypothetical protein